MKILQITQRFPPAIGGVETHVFNLSKHLLLKGHEVTVFTSDLLQDAQMKRLFSSNSVMNGVDVRRFRAYQLWPKTGTSVVMPKIIREMLQIEFDVVHAHNYLYFSSIVAAVTKRLRKIPFVLTAHACAEYSIVRRFLRTFYDLIPGRFIVRQANQIIVLSENELNHLISIGVPSHKIQMVPHGVDFRLFSEASRLSFRKKYGLSGKIILFVGRLEEKKGLFTLVESVAKVREGMGNVTTVMVGDDWGLKNKLLRFSRLLGVSDLLAFTGPLYGDELASAYAASDVFVLPSISEVFGLVLLEAMAAGKPIIASCVGGVPNIVKETNGILVPPGDSDALARGIVKLLKDEKLASFYGRQNQLEATSYSWEKVAEQVERIYMEAVENR